MYYNFYTVLTPPMDIAVRAHGQLWHCTVVWPWMKLLWKDLFQKSLSEAVPPSLNNCIWVKTLHHCPCLDYTATCLAIYPADLNPDHDLFSWLDLGPTSSLQMCRVITWLLAELEYCHQTLFCTAILHPLPMTSLSLPILLSPSASRSPPRVEQIILTVPCNV